MDLVIIFAWISIVVIFLGSMSTLLRANVERPAIGSGTAVIVVIINALLALDLYILIQRATNAG